MSVSTSLFAVIVLVGVFPKLSDCSDENIKLFDKRNVGRMLWAPIRSARKIQDFLNFSVYLGYANNPFGPSTRVLNKYQVANSSQAQMMNDGNSLQEINGISSEGFDDVDPGPLLSHSSQEQRSKRGVVHLYNMVSCATGCNPLIYKGYGCYCGFLGSGYAVDGIDRCCKMHDWCYDTANCPMFLEYFVPYLWKCYHNRPLCAVSHGEWGGPGSCAQRLCECDRALSECLRRFPCPSSRALCRSSPWRLIQNALMVF